MTKKDPSKKEKFPLQIYNVGSPFDKVQMDILGLLPTTSKENCYLLIIIDYFTKWVEALSLKNIKA